jgi:hypothetical protein
MQRPVLKEEGNDGTEGTQKAEKAVDRGAIRHGFVVTRYFVVAPETIELPGNCPTGKPGLQRESNGLVSMWAHTRRAQELPGSGKLFPFTLNPVRSNLVPFGLLPASKPYRQLGISGLPRMESRLQ